MRCTRVVREGLAKGFPPNRVCKCREEFNGVECSDGQSQGENWGARTRRSQGDSRIHSLGGWQVPRPQEIPAAPGASPSAGLGREGWRLRPRKGGQGRETPRKTPKALGREKKEVGGREGER